MARLPLAIAFAATRILPALPWAAALLLGAILAPSDPVSAIAALRRLDTPRAVDTILAGERLVNDATALVAYAMTVDAIVSGAPLSVAKAAVHTAIVDGGGIAVGLLVGVASRGCAAGSIAGLVRAGLLISAVAIGVRLLWIFPGTYLPRLLDRWMGRETEALPPWQNVFFVGWAGIRGADSLVVALALPLVVAAGRPFRRAA